MQHRRFDGRASCRNGGGMRFVLVVFLLACGGPPCVDSPATQCTTPSELDVTDPCVNVIALDSRLSGFVVRCADGSPATIVGTGRRGMLLLSCAPAP